MMMKFSFQQSAIGLWIWIWMISPILLETNCEVNPPDISGLEFGPAYGQGAGCS